MASFGKRISKISIGSGAGALTAENFCPCAAGHWRLWQRAADGGKADPEPGPREHPGGAA